MVGGSNGASIEILVTPEGSFPYYEVVQACIPPNTIATALFECEALLFNICCNHPCNFDEKNQMTALQGHKESKCVSLLGFSHCVHFLPTFIDHH